MLCVIDVVSGLNSEKIWAGRLGYPSDFLGCLFWERQRWTKKKKKKKKRKRRKKSAQKEEKKRIQPIQYV